MPPPGTPFPAPPAPENGSGLDEEELAAFYADAEAAQTTQADPPAAEPNWISPELDARGAGRDLTLALRGIEEIDMRMKVLQLQLAAGVGVMLVLLAGLVAAYRVKARASS
jgi:hypothetical protein